jgi:hypothetical protein
MSAAEPIKGTLLEQGEVKDTHALPEPISSIVLVLRH